MQPDLGSLYRQMKWQKSPRSSHAPGRTGDSSRVIDLRTVATLDEKTVCAAVARTSRMLVVDEGYRGYGLSGEPVAEVLESETPSKYGRVFTESTIQYVRDLGDQVLPNVPRIVAAAGELVDK